MIFPFNQKRWNTKEKGSFQEKNNKVQKVDEKSLRNARPATRKSTEQSFTETIGNFYFNVDLTIEEAIPIINEIIGTTFFKLRLNIRRSSSKFEFSEEIQG